MEKPEKRILIDADVIFHLFRADRLSVLKELYQGRIYILDLVVEELKSFAPSQLAMITGLGILQEMSFPTSNKDILQEYTRLRNENKGKGESACMAVCRHNDNIIASNNTKDIKHYCEQFNIQYLTTMDVLAVGYLKGMLTAAEGDYCIYLIKVQSKKFSKHDQIQDYVDNNFDKEKLNY